MNVNLSNNMNIIMTMTMFTSTKENINMSRKMTMNTKMIEQVNERTNELNAGIAE